jgi:hypothetical protein
MSGTTTCHAVLSFSKTQETCPVTVEQGKQLCMFHQGRVKKPAKQLNRYNTNRPAVRDEQLVAKLAPLLTTNKDVVLRKMATFLSLLQTQEEN